MRIYLAGRNGMHRIVDMVIYLAGGMSGNLNPAFRKMARGNNITADGFMRALIDENFWQGGRLDITYNGMFTGFRP